MPWNDIEKLTGDLKRALDEFDWEATKEVVCGQLIPRIKSEPKPLDEQRAKELLQLAKDVLHKLRRKRRFQLMAQFAEALVQSGLSIPQVRRQYAQALIDQGVLTAGETILQSIIQDPKTHVSEEMEARGLMGRIYKQLYVNNNDPVSPANRANLERALNEYLYAYEHKPEKNLWHAINVVALAARARRDQLPLTNLPDDKALAREILQTLAQREEEETEAIQAWDIATALEAYVALGEYKKALNEAARYLFSEGADAFELGSTLRQLTEVWQLNEEEPPGNLLLPLCKAGYMRKQGASHFEKDPKKIAEEAAAADKAIKSLESTEGYEKVFGSDAMVTLGWYKRGLEQCTSIARVEKKNGKGHGTGWLVKAEDFFPGRPGLLLLTNEHVISEEDPHDEGAIFPESARANFQSVGQVIPVGEIVWSSPHTELDSTFVTLKEEPQAKPLKLSETPVRMAKPAPRMYVIGHPAGRDLEISLQDNHLLDLDERRLHYRTPTEPGSSGSPVFEQENWEVVALHHKGRDDMPRLGGKEGVYPANEGISLTAIRQRTRGQ